MCKLGQDPQLQACLCQRDWAKKKKKKASSDQAAGQDSVCWPSLHNKKEDELLRYSYIPRWPPWHWIIIDSECKRSANIYCSSAGKGLDGDVYWLLDARRLLNSHPVLDCQCWVKWPLKREADFKCGPRFCANRKRLTAAQISTFKKWTAVCHWDLSGAGKLTHLLWQVKY